MTSFMYQLRTQIEIKGRRKTIKQKLYELERKQSHMSSIVNLRKKIGNWNTFSAASIFIFYEGQGWQHCSCQLQTIVKTTGNLMWKYLRQYCKNVDESPRFLDELLSIAGIYWKSRKELENCKLYYEKIKEQLIIYKFRRDWCRKWKAFEYRT